jgi:hypothetical protein
VVLSIANCNCKITALLEDQAYKKLKGPAESMDRKTTLLKKSSLSEEVCQQLRLQGSRPLRLYGLLKVHKQGVLLRTIVSTIGTPTTWPNIWWAYSALVLAILHTR